MPMQPSLFISHGSPMMLVQDGELRQFLGSLGDSLNAAFGRPDAILIASAHWMTPRPVVGAAAALEVKRPKEIALSCDPAVRQRGLQVFFSCIRNPGATDDHFLKVCQTIEMHQSDIGHLGVTQDQ